MRKLIAALVLLVALWFGNLWVEGPKFDRYYEGVVILVGINIVLAVALNIVNGFTGQFSLGHIGFYAVGAYVAVALSTYGHTLFVSPSAD